MSDPIVEHYERLKNVAKTDLRSDAVAKELSTLCRLSMEFVHDYCDLRPLKSFVPGKSYEMAVLKTGLKSSRPINATLFDSGIKDSDIDTLMKGVTVGLSEDALQRRLYTIAMSYCLAVDLVSTDNRKSPGTFFEILIGHLAAMKLGVNPATKIAIPSLDIDNTLPTDFIFDLGPGKTKIHMPVKLSTRERVVQAWAHQRVLEGMHGAGRFKGILVIMTETNKQKNKSVVEVCLPGQWAAYQMYISPMYRVYYLDLPKKYEPLRDKYPHIPVWPFSRFFNEFADIQSSGQ